ncbi:MAG: CHASE domain-containing protein [Bdellovibrio sp.]
MHLLISGVVALSFYSFLHKSYIKEGQAQFDRAVNILNAKVDSYIGGLHGIGSIYLSRGFKISNKEAREYAEFSGLFTNFPGVLGFGFIRYLDSNQRESYVKEIRQQKGFEDFNIKKFSNDANKKLMVIESLEPREFNKTAIGFDISSEEKRNSAALRAMQTGLPVISEHVHLIQTSLKENGFMLYLPLYEKGIVPQTEEERRQKIKGWAVAPVTASAIKEYLLKNIDSSLKFEVFEQVGSGANVKILDNGYLRHYDFEKPVKIGERIWTVKGTYEKDGFVFYMLLLRIFSFLILAILLIGISVSVRKLVLSKDETEKRAQQAEDWFSTIINSSNLCILSTDKYGLISTLNKTAENILGYTEQEVVRKLSASFFLGPIKKSATMNEEIKNTKDIGDLLEKAKLHGVETAEIDAFKRNGNKFPSRLIVTPVNSDSGLEGFLLVLEDLTEVVRMRREIDIKQQQIIAASRLSSLGELAAGLAHEINNPLAIISSKVDVTLDQSKKGKLSSELLEESLQKINAMVHRIARLVRGLKTLSRDATTDPFVPVLVIDLINDSIGLCGKRITNHSIKIFVECSSKITVQGRAPQLTQVLINLLSNAIDAVEPLNDKWIKIQVKELKDIIQIEVIDSGRGIETDIAEKILNPFFTTKDIGKGTGLGLSISKSIIDEHKGKLSLDNSQANTTFVIELPLINKPLTYSCDQNENINRINR